jgi:undecaprenyl diphosphate synthase
MPRPTPELIAEAREQTGIPPERFPRSVAIIMDGNGRWARERGLPRPLGHREGAHVVRRIVREATRLGMQALTLYSFSSENWSRPPEEVDALMHLYAEYFINERPELMENNVRMRVLGSREGLPDYLIKEMDESLRVSSANTGMWLCLALNYGSRNEITRAVRSICRRVADGELAPEDVGRQTISDSLDTAGVPDPDLLVRTAGEMRISNYLLWQISYAELYVTETYWPDFDEEEFQKALAAFADRHRRFGGVDASNT